MSQSFQVTAVYTDDSTAKQFNVPRTDTVAALKVRVREKLTLQGKDLGNERWGLNNDFIHPDNDSILLFTSMYLSTLTTYILLHYYSTDSRGNVAFQNNRTVESICSPSDHIFAIMPAPSEIDGLPAHLALRFQMQSPVLSNMTNLIKSQMTDMKTTLVGIQRNLEGKLENETQARKKTEQRLEETTKKLTKDLGDVTRELGDVTKELGDETRARRKAEERLEEATKKLTKELTQVKTQLSKEKEERFEDRRKLDQQHELELERERRRVKEKDQERLATEKERDAMYESFQDQLDETISATADFVSGVCTLPLFFSFCQPTDCNRMKLGSTESNVGTCWIVRSRSSP
jgi:DNA repair exonuclease SbcCD ATPase subunit